MMDQQKRCSKCKENKPATTEYFYKDLKSKTRLSSWCRQCQKQGSKSEIEPEPSKIDISQYMPDARGRLVHIDQVKEIDKTRDELVRQLVDNAQAVQAAMSQFKANAMSEITAFVELSAQEYDVKLGGKKGNITLFSFDGKYKVQVQIAEYLVFDERLQVAKTMIDECFNHWTQDSRSEIKTIINDAFAVNQEGKINVKRILSLRRLDITDQIWQKAMKAISDSLQVAGTKSYMRIYERVSNQDQWRHISLDFAAL